MKLIKIILEQWQSDTITVMGIDKEHPYTGRTGNIGEFFQAIDKLPNTIKSIKVPLNTKRFKTSADSITISPTPGFQEEIKKRITDLVEQYKKEGEEVSNYHIKSFTYEVENGKYYIQLETEKSAEFEKQMGSGQQGSLD